MEMFLMVLCISLLGIAVTAVAFGAAARDAEAAPAAEAERESAVVPVLARAGFFAAARDYPAASRVPIEVLLLQIERHIRLEQAAAESFLDCPTCESLHTPTASPLVH